MKRSMATLLRVLACSSLLISPHAVAEGHWFIGGAAGAAQVDEDFDGLPLDDNASSFRLYGGYRFNDYLAVEGAYVDLGEFEQSFNIIGLPVNLSADADGFAAAVMGAVPLGERFDLEGRLGLFFWDGRASAGTLAADPSDENLFLGLGASFDLSRNIAVTGDWTRYELEDVEADVFTIGFRINFL